jgi:hypothetical protein
MTNVQTFAALDVPWRRGKGAELLYLGRPVAGWFSYNAASTRNTSTALIGTNQSVELPQA